MHTETVASSSSLLPAIADGDFIGFSFSRYFLTGNGAFAEAELEILDAAIPDDIFQHKHEINYRVEDRSAPRHKKASKQVRVETGFCALPEIGAVIDKYRIDELLGTGAFAAVYRATHLLLRIPVALKMLKPEVIYRNPSLAELLCEEARFIALLNHPNIVRIFDVTRTNEITYIVMEYIEGVSLAATLERLYRLPLSDVVRLGTDVCSGLNAAMAQGLIHRDVKPANILISRSGDAKLVDLGQALSTRVMENEAFPSDAIVGTPTYMSPEQATLPERVNFRSDMYSLGITLYEAAAGHVPFRSRNLHDLIHMHETAEVPSPMESIPGCTPEFDALLLILLEKNPEERPESYDRLLAMLRGVQISITAAANRPPVETLAFNAPPPKLVPLPDRGIRADTPAVQCGLAKAVETVLESQNESKCQEPRQPGINNLSQFIASHKAITQSDRLLAQVLQQMGIGSFKHEEIKSDLRSEFLVTSVFYIQPAERCLTLNLAVDRPSALASYLATMNTLDVEDTELMGLLRDLHMYFHKAMRAAFIEEGIHTLTPVASRVHSTGDFNEPALPPAGCKQFALGLAGMTYRMTMIEHHSPIERKEMNRLAINDILVQVPPIPNRRQTGPVIPEGTLLNEQHIARIVQHYKTLPACFFSVAKMPNHLSGEYRKHAVEAVTRG